MKQSGDKLIFHPEPEGGFTVTVPALPGCITYGKNLEEAEEMAHDAIKAYIASLEKHREEIPRSRTKNLFKSLREAAAGKTEPLDRILK